MRAGKGRLSSQEVRNDSRVAGGRQIKQRIKHRLHMIQPYIFVPSNALPRMASHN